VVIVNEPAPELPLLDEAPLLPLEDELLPLELEDELELELELELVAALPPLLSSWPHAATARYEIAASRLSSSVEWRMRSVRIRRATSGHHTYSAKMTRKKMSRSRDGVFGTPVTLFVATQDCRRWRRDPDVQLPISRER
jgi:hypothetical protein